MGELRLVKSAPPKTEVNQISLLCTGQAIHHMTSTLWICAVSRQVGCAVSSSMGAAASISHGSEPQSSPSDAVWIGGANR